MSRKIMYRRQLLRAIELFMEESISSKAIAQNIIKRCYVAISDEMRKLTLDEVIWGHFIKALTDSVFYERKEYLQEMQEILLGHSSQPIARAIFQDDYRRHFTADETDWHAQLLSMLDFIAMIPLRKIHEATFPAWQNKATWATMRSILPEAIQAEEVEKEYQ